MVSFLWMAELLRLRDRSWVCCRGWPRFGCTIMIACGFEVCAANPRIRCLRAQRQSSDPRFAQQNPRMVRIRTLCLT